MIREIYFQPEFMFFYILKGDLVIFFDFMKISNFKWIRI